MKWFKEHKKAASIGLFLLVLILIGCGVAFSDSGNGSDQKEQEASVTDTKKETAEEKKSSDAEVKKEDAVKEKVSEEKIETKEEAKKEEKKDDTATATTKKDEAKTSSSKSSSSSSTKKTETKANNSSSSNSSKPQHTHTWVAQTKSVYHEATGHYENKWVQDSAAWDEDVYATKVICNCGAVFDSVDAWGQHTVEGCRQGYYVDDIKIGTVHHEATGHNEQKWVQDSAAWTETVTTGYKCSGCGATK